MSSSLFMEISNNKNSTKNVSEIDMKLIIDNDDVSINENNEDDLRQNSERSFSLSASDRSRSYRRRVMRQRQSSVKCPSHHRLSSRVSKEIEEFFQGGSETDDSNNKEEKLGELLSLSSDPFNKKYLATSTTMGSSCDSISSSFQEEEATAAAAGNNKYDATMDPMSKPTMEGYSDKKVASSEQVATSKRPFSLKKSSSGRMITNLWKNMFKKEKKNDNDDDNNNNKDESNSSSTTASPDKRVVVAASA